jgi:hypothetical protein
MHTSAKTVFIFLVIAALVLSGCASIGPGTVKRDQFQYIHAISESWKAQLLLNMVKIRYGDTPAFLEVASLINSYSIESGIDLNVNWYNYPYETAQLLKGSAKFTDRPTITYSPLTGEKFTTMLMSPIEPTNIFSFIQAGYPSDLVLRICVQSINGIHNKYGGGARFKRADPEFFPLLEKLRAIQDSGAFGMRVENVEGKDTVVLIFRDPRKIDEQIKADIAAVRKLLNLNPQASKFKIVYDAVAANDQEIAILSRSMMQILIDLGSLIDVPEKHIAEKRVSPTRTCETVGGISARHLISVHSRASAPVASKPGDAFAAVKYHNYWFWIDDTDLLSKQVMTFLLVIFSLAETGGAGKGPIVTVPAG